MCLILQLPLRDPALDRALQLAFEVPRRGLHSPVEFRFYRNGKVEKMFISSFRLERKTPFSTGGNMWTCSNMQYIYNCVNENKPLLKKCKLVKMLNYDHIWNPCTQKAVCLYRSSIYKWHFTSCSWNTEILCCSLKWDDNTTICSRLTGKCLVRATKIQGCVIQQVKQLIGLLLFFFLALWKSEKT